MRFVLRNRQGFYFRDPGFSDSSITTSIHEAHHWVTPEAACKAARLTETLRSEVWTVETIPNDLPAVTQWLRTALH